LSITDNYGRRKLYSALAYALANSAAACGLARSMAAFGYMRTINCKLFFKHFLIFKCILSSARSLKSSLDGVVKCMHNASIPSNTNLNSNRFQDYGPNLIKQRLTA